MGKRGAHGFEADATYSLEALSIPYDSVFAINDLPGVPSKMAHHVIAEVCISLDSDTKCAQI